MANLPTRSDPRPGRLAAVVLAAGLSRRMGENKLLLPVGGVPLVRRSVVTLLGYPFAEVVIVTGHERAGVSAAVGDLPVRLVHNPRYDEGQMTSVRAGLAALSDRPDEGRVTDVAGVMVCLSDQPALTLADVTLIADGFFERAGCAVLVPMFGGARGNPIVLGWNSLGDILARDANFGCKQFVSKNADVVTTLAMPNDHVLVDVDRPEDYAAFVHRLDGGEAE